MFGSAGNKKAFALGAGAGFVGGGTSSGSAMKVFHKYLMYRAIKRHRGWGGHHYGGLGFRPHGGRLYMASRGCGLGGCPMQAFCDYGICRCREGYEARFGHCYENFGTVFDERYRNRKKI